MKDVHYSAQFLRSSMKKSPSRSRFHPVVLGMLLVFGLSTMMVMAASLPGANLSNSSEAKMGRQVTTPANNGNIVCMDQYEPVCGKDGQTYTNGCYALRAGTEIAFDGDCVTGRGSNVPDNPGMMRY